MFSKLLITLAILGNFVAGTTIFDNCVNTNKQINKQILLTFDDGPDVNTHAFADTLTAYGIHGLFFINGIKVYRNNQQDLVKSLYNAGHVFGTHTYSHVALTGLNGFNIRREFYDNELDVFRKLFNKRPYFVRAPYFDHDDRVMGIYDEFGYVEVNPSFESTDWQAPDNYTRVIETIKAQIDTGKSFITLLHEHIGSNANVLPAIIPYAQSKGYSFVDPIACLGVTQNYQAENTYGPNLLSGV